MQRATLHEASPFSILTSMTITVSTDGSALGNPNGPMGWAWADHSDAESKASADHHHYGDCDAGGATNGTNQIGELCAVLQALRAHRGSEPLLIESDSQYAINCSTKWVHGWKKNGWKNSQKKPVKNADVIKAIDKEITSREGSVKFRWVKGHAGNAGNEKVDELARTYAQDCRSGAKDGYLPKEGWRSLLKSEYADDSTDVPADAQLLLDGAITDEAYVKSHTADPDVPIEETEHESVEVDKDETQPVAGRAGAVNAETGELADQTQEAAAPRSVSSRRPERAQERQAPRFTGITVSGAVHMAPEPRTSPSFTGGARHIHGFVEVDGYVEPDGTLTLSNAPFLA